MSSDRFANATEPDCTPSRMPSVWAERVRYLAIRLRQTRDLYWLRRTLRALPPHLLADLGIDRNGIDAFARKAVLGNQVATPIHYGEEPMTIIGSDIWVRAILLHPGA